MIKAPQTVVEKWAHESFQKEKADSQLYSAFEQLFLGAYQRARHEEAFDAAFGIGSPFAKEFSLFLTTISCPDFLAEEARSDFAYYREIIDEGFPHNFSLRYTAERREGRKHEEAIDCVFSRLDLEDKLHFLIDYFLAHGQSEQTARDSAFNIDDETPLKEALATFREREQKEKLMLGQGSSPERAYAFAKAVCEGGSSEDADLYSWYFEKEMQRKSEWEEAQHLAQEFVSIVPIYVSLHENRNYEAYTYALTQVEHFRRARGHEVNHDYLELFMTVAVRLQAQKKTGKETDFYDEVETLAGKIGRGEISLNDLPGAAPAEPQDWRIALRRFWKKSEEREWEEFSSDPGIENEFHHDPAIVR